MVVVLLEALLGQDGAVFCGAAGLVVIIVIHGVGSRRDDACRPLSGSIVAAGRLCAAVVLLRRLPLWRRGKRAVRKHEGFTNELG
jgi:hypothetical protein